MPSTFTDPVPGELMYESEIEEWVGSVSLDRATVALTVSADTLPDQNLAADVNRDALKRCTETYVRVNGSLNAIRQQCAERLQPFAEEWRLAAGHTEPVTIRAVSERITPTGLCLYPDGQAELFFADDGLFEGHSIIVSLDEHAEVTDAGI